MGFPLWARLAVGVGTAAMLAYLTTPIAITTARRLAFYDVPAGYKGHRSPTPYLGGAALTLAFVASLLLAAPAGSDRTLSLVGGILVLFAVGTIDDRRTLSPQLRVAIEFSLGVLISVLGHGWQLGAGHAIDACVNGAWVVAVVNAFNLFDNMDGAASTMAIVAAAAAGTLGWLHHDAWAVAASAALAGAALGFLPYNLARPARIFLGDGGSLPLGFAVAVLVASTARGTEPSVLGLITGVLLVGLPAIDLCLVIVSRHRRGVSIFTAGQDHLTHRTRRRVLTARRVALVLGSTQALVSALVIVATRSSSATLVYALLAFVVCAAVAIVGLEQPTVGTALAGGSEPAGNALRARSKRWRGPGAALAAVGLGLGAGLSPFFSSYYDTGVWVPIGLVLIVVATAAALARPPRFTLPVTLVLVGLAGLGLLSLISGSWSQGVEQTIVAGNRWLLYAALFLLAVVLTRDSRAATALLIAAGIGTGVVAASVLVRMLGSDPATLFLAGRLNSPLGYVNGEGCVFAMGCWLSLAVAERRQPVLAGAGAAVSVAFACLALLSQSRGAAIAIAVAVLVALLVIPGVRRRLLALAAIAGGIALAWSAVVNVYSTGRAGVPPTSVVHSAAAAILAASAATGVLWGLIVALRGAAARRGGELAAAARRAATIAAVAAVALPAAGGLIRISSIEHTVSTQWHAFVDLKPASASGTSTHLFTGAGNRYDYWRIAWNVFLDHPVAGVGAGNYVQYYFVQRRTTEAIENPHSIELQTLSELGVIGAAALLLIVAGVVVAVARMRPAARGPGTARTLMVAAVGVVVVWFVDSSGDWMPLLPGVTAVALAAVAVLSRTYGPEPAPRRAFAPTSAGVRLPALAGAAAVGVVLAIGGASLLRAGITQLYLDSAHSELAAHPASAITDARRALRLDAANLDAYYVEAAGLARFDRAAAARAILLDAAREDPGEYVTWVLLGDLEVRAGDLRAARTFYRRARTLDPNDPAIASLAADPAGALNRPTG